MKQKDHSHILHRVSLYEYVLIIILAVGAFFRFYNLPARYGFDFDSTRDALIALKGAQDFVFPLLGPASALGPFHFGPWYYYQLIAFQMLVPLMYAPWVYIALLSLLGIYIGYRIGIELGDKTLGLLIAGFVGLSPAQIAPAVGLSNPNLVAVPALAAVWLFIKLIKEKLSWKWSVAFGFILGLGINNHFQMIPLLLLPAVALFLTKQKRPEYIVSTFFGFAVSFLPLFIFDLTHNFINIKGFLFYLTEGQRAVYIPNSWTIYLRDFWPDFLVFLTGVPLIAISLLFLLTVVSFMQMFSLKRFDKPLLILAFVFFVEFLYLRYYSGIRESYYLLYLHPLLFIFLSVGVWWLFKQKFGRLVGSIIVLVFLLFNLQTNIQFLRPPESHAEVFALSEFILKSVDRDKVTFYDCSERIRFQTMSLEYIFGFQNRTSTAGVPVAILDHNCDENLRASSLIKKRFSMENIHREYKNLRHTEVYVLDTSEKARLEIEGWKHVTRENVYQENISKWFENN